MALSAHGGLTYSLPAPAQDPLEVPDSVGSTLRFGLWLGLLLAMCSLPAAQMNE